jgi:hypothetical protein
MKVEIKELQRGDGGSRSIVVNETNNETIEDVYDESKLSEYLE